MNIEFLKAEVKDIELIRELAEESWRAGYASILSAQQIDYMLAEMYSVAEITVQFNNPSYHYYLIYGEEKPVGFLGFENEYELFTTKLHRLYLIPEYKGKGIGKAALIFLKETARETDDTKIILNVNKNNPAKSIYESQGFRVYNEAVIDIGNGFVMDDYLMEYTL